MKKPKPFKVILMAYQKEVTGSKTLLEIMYTDGTIRRILIECGYFQEQKYQYLNYVKDIDPSTIDAILITHNHIDHTGLLPKMVKQGYANPIYMTKITQELLPSFLFNSEKQQDANVKHLKDKYPEARGKFKKLYYREDVQETIKLCVGVEYYETREILPGVKVTFLVNGHIIGAAMILVQCECVGRKPINLFFTGDYKLRNVFFDVPDIPDRIKNMNLIMIHEATMADTRSEDIEVCFIKNLLEALSKRQYILLCTHAQGRTQEVLYDLRKLQERGLIPNCYDIEMDGPLAIYTTKKYGNILERINPETSDFLPKGIKIINPADRNDILKSDRPKIIVTTSGMLSQGPARQYVPMFLPCSNALIHIMGYAAEGTLARSLLKAKNSESITIASKVYKKRADIKATREKTAHATLDEMLEFLSKFKNIEFLAINHATLDEMLEFKSIVNKECPNIKAADILNRDNMYSICQFAGEQDECNRIVVKKKPSKLEVVLPKKQKKHEKRCIKRNKSVKHEKNHKGINKETRK